MSDRRFPLTFFLLVFALSIPFALLGTTGIQLLPGIPISALGFVCPVTAAAILVWRESGTAGVRAFLKRSFDYRRIPSKIWYAPVVLLMPSITLLAYGLLRLMGAAVAHPHFSVAGTPVLFLIFFVAALGEELGWSGYAIDPLQARYGALRAAILLGIVWAAWHIPAMVQGGQWPAWIAWGCLDMVATRVLMVWLYDNTGKSVFAVALYHATANVSTKTIFPGGSYPAERIIGLILVVAAGLAVLGWRSLTLAGDGVPEQRRTELT